MIGSSTGRRGVGATGDPRPLRSSTCGLCAPWMSDCSRSRVRSTSTTWDRNDTARPATVAVSSTRWGPADPGPAGPADPPMDLRPCPARTSGVLQRPACGTGSRSGPQSRGQGVRDATPGVPSLAQRAAVHRVVGRRDLGVGRGRRTKARVAGPDRSGTRRRPCVPLPIRQGPTDRRPVSVVPVAVPGGRRSIAAGEPPRTPRPGRWRMHSETGGTDAERSRSFYYHDLVGRTVETDRHGYGVVDTGSDVGIAEDLGGRRLLGPVPVASVRWRCSPTSTAVRSDRSRRLTPRASRRCWRQPDRPPVHTGPDDPDPVDHSLYRDASYRGMVCVRPDRRTTMINATVGDQIEIMSATLDSPRRRGEVVEVIGTGEAQHYRVRWQDGHESLYFPGPDAHLSQSAG